MCRMIKTDNEAEVEEVLTGTIGTAGVTECVCTATLWITDGVEGEI